METSFIVIREGPKRRKKKKKKATGACREVWVKNGDIPYQMYMQHRYLADQLDNCENSAPPHNRRDTDNTMHFLACSYIKNLTILS